MQRQRRYSHLEVLAAYLETCVEDLRDYRYQSTRTRDPIYSQGDDDYYCASKRKPSASYGWPGQNTWNWVEQPFEQIWIDRFPGWKIWKHVEVTE